MRIGHALEHIQGMAAFFKRFLLCVIFFRSRIHCPRIL